MRLKSHALILYVAMTAAGFVTLAFMGAYLAMMRRDGRDAWFVYAFVSPFVLVGSLLVYSGASVLLLAARLGRWQLDVPDGGGRLGVPLTATLFPSRERTPSGELTCRLRSIRVIASAGKGRPSDRRTLWETSWTVRAGLIHPSIGLPLTLPLPADGEATDVSARTGAGVMWQLDVVVPSGSMSDQAVFDVPVRH